MRYALTEDDLDSSTIETTEATVEGKPFYQKHGFYFKDYEQKIMVRNPGAARYMP